MFSYIIKKESCLLSYNVEIERRLAMLSIMISEKTLNRKILWTNILINKSCIFLYFKTQKKIKTDLKNIFTKSDKVILFRCDIDSDFNFFVNFCCDPNYIIQGNILYKYSTHHWISLIFHYEIYDANFCKRISCMFVFFFFSIHINFPGQPNQLFIPLF